MQFKDFNGRKVLVTGAGGFIGSHLAETLTKQGAQVRAMVHYNSSNHWGNLNFLSKDVLRSIEVFQGDLADPFSVRNAVEDQEIVFHLGALIAIPYSYVAPQSYVSTNVMGTLNVLQACRDARTPKILHTSTSETYGTAIYTPIDEVHPLQGQSPYSATKIGADKIAESYHLSFGLPVVTVRPFNTYGPRQSARAVIPTVISQMVSGAKEIKLGSLTPVRDFNFVLDTVNGFLACAKSDRVAGEVVNLGFGKGVTIGALVELLSELTGQKVTVTCDQQRVRPEKSEVMELIAANKKAKELCDWQPQYTLREGLTQTIDFVRENIAHYKPNIYNV
jgi:NAD dependent epimerase/dehydratase